MINTVGFMSSQATAGPPSTETSIDFVGGSYVVNGVTVTAADIVDHSEWITANGLEIPEDGDNNAAIIGPLFDVLASMNWTMILEYEELVSGGTTRLITIVDGEDFNEGFDLVRFGSGVYGAEDYAFSGSRFINDLEVHGPGVHKVSITRTNGRLSMSADGGDVVTDTSFTFSVTPGLATLGGDPGFGSGNACYIRKLEFIDPVPDADLPPLSA